MLSPSVMDVVLGPVEEDDVTLFRRFAVEPGRLTVRTGVETAGFVS